MTSESAPHRDERRKSKRFRMGLEVEYRTLTQNPIYGNGTSSDISRDGIALDGARDFRRGVTVQIKMNVPGDNLPVFATGTVAWAQGEMTGVRLTKISKTDQERILEMIYQNWLQGQRLAQPGGGV